MDKHEIIKALEAEKQRLTKAITALNLIGHGRRRMVFGRRKRHLSAAARRKISKAQKKRWAVLRQAEVRTKDATNH